MDTLHHYLVCGTRFDIPARYTLEKPIGKGAYGLVVAAKDNLTGQKVAIKKITDFSHRMLEAKRIMREVKLLVHFKHENIVKVTDILPPPAFADFSDIYIVFELMDTDLHQIIVSDQQLTDEHCQYFLYQMLRGLKYIHSANVLHRDLKPSNMFLNENCDLKVGDFGLARGFQENFFLSEYVATRWYRAPEIILEWQQYTKAVDIWAVGCIFAELLGRRPLFPGADYVDQLKKILLVIGTPTREDIQHGSEKAKTFLANLPPRSGRNFKDLFPNASYHAIDLLSQMLKFNPDKRITVEAALKHPFFEALHDPADEPVCSNGAFDFSFETACQSTDDVKRVIYDHIRRHYHNDLPPLDVYVNAGKQPQQPQAAQQQQQHAPAAPDVMVSETPTAPVGMTPSAGSAQGPYAHQTHSGSSVSSEGLISPIVRDDDDMELTVLESPMPIDQDSDMDSGLVPPSSGVEQLDESNLRDFERSFLNDTNV